MLAPRFRPPEDVGLMLVVDPDRIRAARLDQERSQAWLGKRCGGLSHTTIGNIERGITRNVSEDVAAKICAHLGLPLEDVFRARALIVVPATESRAPADFQAAS